MGNSEGRSIVDNLEKMHFVWFENEWRHDGMLHWHRKGQLIYVETGYQYITVEGHTYLVPQNHAIWIPPTAIHKTNSNSEIINLRVLFFGLRPGDTFYHKVRVFSVPLVLKEMILYTEKWSKKLIKDRNEFLCLSAILCELPNMIKNSINIHIKTPEDIRLKKSMDYFYENFVTIKKIDELVSLSALSLRTFERVFKKETGLTFVKYQQMLRIIKSMELLSKKQLTISEIAHEVGYKSLHSFTKSFFSIMHVSPSQFLKTL